MGTNGKSNYMVSRDELAEVCHDIEKELNMLRAMLNNHGQVLTLHRFILAKFVPAPMLEQATNEFKEAAEQLIAEERAKAEHGTAPQA